MFGTKYRYEVIDDSTIKLGHTKGRLIATAIISAAYLAFYGVTIAKLAKSLDDTDTDYEFDPEDPSPN